MADSQAGQREPADGAPPLWKGDALRGFVAVLVALLGSFGLVLVAGALAATIPSGLDTTVLAWGGAALGAALVLYLPGRYALRRTDL